MEAVEERKREVGKHGIRGLDQRGPVEPLQGFREPGKNKSGLEKCTIMMAIDTTVLNSFALSGGGGGGGDGSGSSSGHGRTANSLIWLWLATCNLQGTQESGSAPTTNWFEGTLTAATATAVAQHIIEICPCSLHHIARGLVVV